MKFYEINLKSIPKIIFSCTVESYNYKNTFPHTPDLLELSVCETGNIVRKYRDGANETIYSGAYNTVVKDDAFFAYCTKGVKQKHTTVGVTADYDYIVNDTDKCDLGLLSQKVKNGTILMPIIWKNDEYYDEILNLINDISYAYVSVNPCSNINALSKWYRLVGRLSEIVLKEAENKGNLFKSGTVKYVNFAKKYIRENYKNKITVDEIAAEAGISSGYLHNIFKNATGMSVVEYINVYRVNLVKQYVKSFNGSLKEASYLVGIDDPAYMSRLFKKVSGMSYRKYCEAVWDERAELSENSKIYQ